MAHRPAPAIPASSQLASNDGQRSSIDATRWTYCHVRVRSRFSAHESTRSRSNVCKRLERAKESARVEDRRARGRQTAGTSEERRHARAIGFGADLAFAARSIDDLRHPDLCSCRAGLSTDRFAAWLEKGARGLQRCRPSISRAQVPPADLSLSFADSSQSFADSSSSTGGPLLPPLDRGCRCVSYTPAQAHLCPELDAGVAAAHSPSVPRSSGWRSRRSTAELAHAGPWLDLARIRRGLVRQLPATAFLSGGFSLEAVDAAAGGSTMEMRMHIIQFFFGRTCEYWLQMLLCKRSQDS
ncbi:hypothetical protein SETIT_9G563100v2 [Setaria italica]|uniref:Uncharacterized protein n=1 Tax=Setaria italica TaxID=4555 RepID=A0A368SWS5_SETIT|nr:hypothetical protein SETIT_9G563100v2 [Setaria italica]